MTATHGEFVFFQLITMEGPYYSLSSACSTTGLAACTLMACNGMSQGSYVLVVLSLAGLQGAMYVGNSFFLCVYGVSY